MTHELKVYFTPRVASRITVLTAKDKKGEEFIVSLYGKGRKFIGQGFQQWLNWLDAEGYKWQLVRSKE